MLVYSLVELKVFATFPQLYLNLCYLNRTSRRNDLYSKAVEAFDKKDNTNIKFS